jgi:hypothetical protein
MKSYKDYSKAFLYIFIHSFAEANKARRIPAFVLLDAYSSQYRHLHRNYRHIERYLASDKSIYNERDYSLYEKGLYKQFLRIDARLRSLSGKQRFPSLEELAEAQA